MEDIWIERERERVYTYKQIAGSRLVADGIPLLDNKAKPYPLFINQTVIYFVGSADAALSQISVELTQKQV